MKTINFQFDPDIFTKDPLTGKRCLRLSDDRHNGLVFNSQGKLTFQYDQGTSGKFPYSNIPGNGINGTVGNTIRYVGADSSVARKKRLPVLSDSSYPEHAVEGVYLPDVISGILGGD